MTTDEGVIKFTAQKRSEGTPTIAAIKQLIDFRNRCHHLGYLGVDPNTNLGFGNISMRNPVAGFWISGSQTSQIAEISNQHFCDIRSVDFQAFSVQYDGHTPPSSETLTHAAVYNASPKTRWVLHTHHPKWRQLCGVIPTTNPSYAYGTQQLSKAIISLTTTLSTSSAQLIAMGGHEDGLIAYGTSTSQILDLLANNLID